MAEKSASSSSTDDEAPSRWYILIGVAAVALGLALVIGLPAVLGQKEGDAPTDPSPVVEVVSVTSQGQRYDIVEEGFLRPRARVDVVPEVAGKVVEIAEDFTLGQRFEAGELLFRLDPEAFQAELEQARANLASAQAAARRAEAAYSRQQNLAEIGASATAQLQAAEAEYRSTQAQVSQARAAVTVAQKRLNDTELRAPFDAIVEREDVSVGQYLAPGSAVATLYDSAAAEVVVSLAPQDAAAVRRAFVAATGPLMAQIEPTGASALTETLEGRVTQIAPGVSRQGRTVDILVLIDDAFTAARDGAVFADDYVAVRLPALSDAPLYSGTEGIIRKQSFVWIVDQENRLARIDVEPVGRTRDRVTFSTGTDLSGARLVTTALTEEAEGMAVRIAEGSETEGDRVAQNTGDAAP